MSCDRGDVDMATQRKDGNCCRRGDFGACSRKKIEAERICGCRFRSAGEGRRRLRTDRSLGIAFDEGASWIHGPKGNPITNLAAQSGANTFLTDDNLVAVYDVNGAPYADSVLTSAESQFDNAVRAVQNSGSLTQSFETVFNALYPGKSADRLWRYMLSAYLEFDTGADISELSSKYFDDDETFRGDDVIITNGYDKITDYLAQGLDVRLNARVSAIDYTAPRIEVSTNAGIFAGDYVVVSVPLGVLKKNAISFTPSLPADKTNAIAKINTGNVNKFLLVWNAPFWDLNLQYIGYTPEVKGKFNYFLNLRKFTSANALMTFALGNYATVSESMSDSEMVYEIMQHLRAIHGGNIPDPIHFLRTKWGQNVNAFGAYTYATNGAATAEFDTLSKEVSQKIFFAGEHTHRAHRGTVHGAYLSGLREAQRIIDLQ